MQLSKLHYNITEIVIEIVKMKISHSFCIHNNKNLLQIAFTEFFIH